MFGRKPSNPGVEATPSAQPATISSGEDDLAAAISDFQAAAAAAIAKIRQEAATASLTDAQRVEKANQFVEETGVAAALVDVWEAVKYFPSWSKRDNFASYNAIGATNVSGENRKENRASTEVVSFSWKAKTWELAHTDNGGSSYDGDYRYAVLRLTVGGEIVYEADIRKYIMSDGGYWEPWGIKALSLGPWVGDLIEAQHIFEANDQKLRNDAAAARLAVQSSKIKF